MSAAGGGGGGGGGGGDAADADARAFRLCGINIGGLTVERISLLFTPPPLSSSLLYGTRQAATASVRDEHSRRIRGGEDGVGVAASLLRPVLSLTQVDCRGTDVETKT